MLSKSGIEYLTHVWNFYPGCKHTTEICPCAPDCWAKGIANRFSQSFEPHLIPEKLLDPLHRQKPARIGVCFTGDLFGDWVDPKIVCTVENAKDYSLNRMGYLGDYITTVCNLCPQHTFFFLTKRPENLRKWGKFPDNAWVGATVCNYEMFTQALTAFRRLPSKNRWLSIEPLMEEFGAADISERLNDEGIKWLVIGGWSGGGTQPDTKWVAEIINAADNAGIPVFLKNNLIRKTWGHNPPEYLRYFKNGDWRQELPEVK